LRRAPSELLSRVPSREPGGPDAQAARIDLDQAIGRLSERRQFIVRAFMDGMNGEAIGRSLGIHRNSVYVHLKHAFAKLREDLRDYREAF
jgi:DNA-binding CsgD family transcriptional regulator